MYESITYETILKRMLYKIPNSFDKREGSIIYDALAPAAVELAQIYMELDVILNETFADTASRQYLIKRVAERGIIPKEAVKAIGKGIFNIDIPINSRFSLGKFNYTAIEKISPGVYKMECQTPGREANGYTGKLIPIQYIKGLEKAELTEIIIPGEDEEETEGIRQRYFDSLNTEAFGGNKKDYQKKVLALSGVGGVKVYPVWNGGGTVKLVILNSEYNKPSQELIDFIQTVIDPVQNQGEGIGIAPIGHVVTVEGVEEAFVDIKTNITYQGNWDWQKISAHVENVIDNYFTQLNKKWSENEAVVIRISQIETRILELEGVLDIVGTKLNHKEENLVLKENQIAQRGVVSG